MINIYRCTNSTNEGDPECSSNEEITEWLLNKIFTIKLFN